MKFIQKTSIVIASVIILLISVQCISVAKNTVFVVNNGVLTAYNGSGGKVDIPDNLGITAIGDNVFKWNSTLTSVVIPEGVKMIGISAFQGCDKLISIAMPVGLTTIGNSAFAGNTNYYLNSIAVPEGVSTIGELAFAGCHYVQSITLPSTLTTIGVSAFANSYGITEIYVPASVTDIGVGAFSLGKFPSIHIQGVAESYAETYAKANDIRFSVTATPSTAEVQINRTAVSIAAYNIDGSNYFKLRDLAHVLNGSEKQFEVGYSFDNLGYGSTNKAISILTNKAYTPIGGEMARLANAESVIVTLESTLPSSSATKLYINGTESDFDFYNINGSNYFKLRDIAKALDFGVTWDAETNTVMIDTVTGFSEKHKS